MSSRFLKCVVEKNISIRREVSIEQAFPFLHEKNHCISIVGAGGKTTLMYQLAKKSSALGMSTIVTTSTHILEPEDGSYGMDFTKITERFQEKQYCVIGKRVAENKLMEVEEQQRKDYFNMADMVFVEADGARGMPCKIPCEKEPVIYKESDIVIGVMGLDALGKRIEDTCFRKKMVAKFLNRWENYILREEDFVEILSSTYGTRKDVLDRDYYVLLNKCDTKDRIESGFKIMEQLKKNGIFQVVLSTNKRGVLL